MNKKQTVVLWILGVLFSIMFFLFGLSNIGSYSVEGIVANFLVFLFMLIVPLSIIFGLLIYTLRNKDN